VLVPVVSGYSLARMGHALPADARDIEATVEYRVHPCAARSRDRATRALVNSSTSAARTRDRATRALVNSSTLRCTLSRFGWGPHVLWGRVFAKTPL
jgi:hypothetical protein